MTLAPIDATNEVAVSDYLTRARDWLSTAVEMTGPEQIAMAKAEIATAAEATKQLGLSKEIQLDAQEMVRRAEYALARSIRKGQAEGTVRSQGVGSKDNLSPGRTELPSPYDFAGKHELHGTGGRPGIYNLGEAEPEDLDEAIDAAKAEGNLSRANVARKAQERSGKSSPAPAEAGTTERAHQEAELINALAQMVRRSLTPKNVSTLSPKAKRRITDILHAAIQTLEGTNNE